MTLLHLAMQTQTAAERFASLSDGLDISLGDRLIGVLGMVTMIGTGTAVYLNCSGIP